LSNINSEINDVAGRIISLSALFPTNKEFLQKCGITNHSLVTDLKKGRIKNPGADILALIVHGTGCNGSWLLTGEGEMFDPGQTLQTGNRFGPAMIKGLITLLEEIEHESESLDKIDLPEGVDLQLARLLVKILERRRVDAT
jgi:hypothetical protein